MKRVVLFFLCGVFLFGGAVFGQVYRWDTGEKISDTVPLLGARFEGQVLDYAAFDKMDLNYVWFNEASMVSAHFMGSNLAYSYFFRTNLTNADLNGANLTEGGLYQANLSQADLSGANLTGADLRSVTLSQADLTDAVIREAFFGYTTDKGFTKEQLYSTHSYKDKDLSGIRLNDNDLKGWNFAGHILRDANFNTANLSKADLSGANLINARFIDANMDSTDLSGSNLSGSNFRGTMLSQAILSGANLTGANLSSSTLSQTILRGANLTNADMVFVMLSEADLTGAVIKGVNFWGSSGFVKEQLYSTESYQNKDLSGITLSEKNLSGWDFAGQNLRGAILNSIDLTEVDLSGANLAEANLSFSILSEKDMSGANLTGAELGFATITGSDLSGANLTGAIMFNANLSRANLSQANLTDAQFGLGGPGGLGGVGMGASLTDTNLAGADSRGASFEDFQLDLAGSVQNFVWPDGRIKGLEIVADETMRIWDYDGKLIEGDGENEDYFEKVAIRVEDGFSVDSDGVLKMVFEDGDWGSTIGFEGGIDVILGGTLELVIDDGVEVSELFGVTFDLFDWDGVEPVGEFDSIVMQDWVHWDLSGLYTTGEVTVIPEPGSLILLGLGGMILRSLIRNR